MRAIKCSKSRRWPAARPAGPEAAGTGVHRETVRVDAGPASAGARAPLKIFAVVDALAVVAAQAAVEIEDPFRLANGASDAPSDRAGSCAHRWATP